MKTSRLFTWLIVHTLITSSYAHTPNEKIKTIKHQAQGLGKHLIIELYDCNPEAIKQVQSVEKIMLEATKAARGTIVAHTFHQFSPYGVSGAVIISESHLTIHTWPEYGYCAVDIFTCGDLDNDAAFEVIKNGLQAKSFSRIEMRRGILS